MFLLSESLRLVSRHDRRDKRTPCQSLDLEDQDGTSLREKSVHTPGVLWNVVGAVREPEGLFSYPLGINTPTASFLI
jgi:hypothetical protein